MADTQDPVATAPQVPDLPPKSPPGSGAPSSGLAIGGGILAGLGGLLVVGAIALVVVHLTQRNKDGYYTSSTVQVAAPGYAITAEGGHIGNLPSVTRDVIGTLRVSATSNNGQPRVIGIRPENALNGDL